MKRMAINVEGLPITVETSVTLNTNALAPVDLTFVPFKKGTRQFGGINWYVVLDKADRTVAMFLDEVSADRVASALDFYSKVAVVDPTYRA